MKKSKTIFKLINILLLTTIFSTSKTYVACEGHFYSGSGSITVINNNELYNINDLGNTVQSLKIHNDKLFVIVNGSSLIHVYEITDLGESLLATIETGDSGPREMEIHNGYLYFTNWYSNDIKYMSLNDFQIIGEIPLDGLPEDIVSDGNYLWVAMNMNLDWTDGNTVLKINTLTNEIEEYTVGDGPKNLLVHNGDVYISRTYYDLDWNTYHGTSRINEDGSIEQMNYGYGLACGGSIMVYNNQIYRSFDGGIAPLDDSLNIQESLRIGDYGYWNVYDVKTIDNNVYIAITDWNELHKAAILNSTGEEIGLYNTGIIPTDFEAWDTCVPNGDYNQDNETNIIDVIVIVEIILDSQTVELCNIDMNHDNLLNITDVILIIDQILNY